MYLNKGKILKRGVKKVTYKKNTGTTFSDTVVRPSTIKDVCYGKRYLCPSHS
jgi:hypothetical protein